jgi:Brp/Blh family beta-carotene 15,15'-monooxygenase
LLWLCVAAACLPAVFLSAAGVAAYTSSLWLLSILLLGLPHGASDWLLYRSLCPEHRFPKWLLFISIYTFLALSFAGLWWIFPQVACFGFICITAWHWGSGDSTKLIRYRKSWSAASFSRGSIVMLSPVVFHTDTSQDVIEKMIHALGNTGEIEIPYTFCMGALLFFIILESAIWIWAVIQRRVTPRNGIEHLFETYALISIFYLFPPLLSIGVYFLWLHALRHSLRLLDLCSMCHKDNVWINLGHLHWKSFSFVAPVLIVMIAWLLVEPELIHSSVQSIANYLVIIAALTFPHALFITVLDLKKTS